MKRPQFYIVPTATIPLPKPTDTRDYSASDEGEVYTGWEVQQGPDFVAVYDKGEVQISYDGQVREPVSVEYARDFAAALLAAAEEASR